MEDPIQSQGSHAELVYTDYLLHVDGKSTSRCSLSWLIRTDLTWYVAGCGVRGQDDAFYFSVQPGDVTAAAGHEVRLDCQASAAGLVYSWQHDATPVTASTRRLQVGSSLLLRRVLPQDAGLYTCLATNASTSFSLTSHAANLHVQCE